VRRTSPSGALPVPAAVLGDPIPNLRYCVGSHSIRVSFGVATESTEVPEVVVADIDTSCCWVLDEL
jgi:hypothetical protein